MLDYQPRASPQNREGRRTNRRKRRKPRDQSLFTAYHLRGGKEVEDFGEDHMVFRGKEEGISRRNQGINCGGL